MPGPQGSEWGPSTIHDNPGEASALNNELYVGRLVWNRLRYLKDPVTGTSQSRERVDRPRCARATHRRSKHVGCGQDATTEIGLRTACTRRKYAERAAALETPFRWPAEMRMLRDGYALISKDLLGCSTARNKGTCNNRLNIRRDALEASVLNRLRTPDGTGAFKEFCESSPAR